jgi:hypothetical protein
MKLSQIKKNPQNPRLIKDEKFKRLKKSLQEFPQMMALRPIVVDADDVVLGGNMRLEALQALSMTEIPDEWVKRASELTEEQKQEFIIKDNAGFGEWDWDALASDWSELPLADWGLDLPEVNAQREHGDTDAQLCALEYRIIVQCLDEQHQAALLVKLEEEGLKCQALIS